MLIYYIETSIPSFYHDTRTQPQIQAMREWTKQWWDMSKPDTLLVTGQPVFQELSKAPNPKKELGLKLMNHLPWLPYSPEIDDIVAIYIKHKIVPNDAMGDAAHLALASFHKCDFLVTWNCKHLANANKFDHINRINHLLGLFSPKLVTPFQLLYEGES